MKDLIVNFNDIRITFYLFRSGAEHPVRGVHDISDCDQHLQGRASIMIMLMLMMIMMIIMMITLQGGEQS